ncbi:MULTISPECIES: hypothetical protein [unclassified Moraxella]|uniref:hypothetical protein n=1 Tax=unclassified Moraxella TaxID=2685852 RepID=UPI002B41172A|nr:MULTISPECIES: hypothetical protein [unclassified Moraxella]
MPQNFTNIHLIIKILAVIVGAVFALTLTGDIDNNGRLKLSVGVLIKLTFSALFGFLMGGWVIEYFDLSSYSYASHGFVMMLCSVFGMTAVGVLYQSIKLATTDKTPSQIVKEVKETFKAIFK